MHVDYGVCYMFIQEIYHFNENMGMWYDSCHECACCGNEDNGLTHVICCRKKERNDRHWENEVEFQISKKMGLFWEWHACTLRGALSCHDMINYDVSIWWISIPRLDLIFIWLHVED
jgi:hypothetical protein